MIYEYDSVFCKQKTEYEMRISDWSSDVCSSDLAAPQAAGEGPRQRVDASAGRRDGGILAPWRDDGNHALARLVEGKNGAAAARPQALGIARHAQQDAIQLEALGQGLQHPDRKSTRLNSSH